MAQNWIGTRKGCWLTIAVGLLACWLAPSISAQEAGETAGKRHAERAYYLDAQEPETSAESLTPEQWKRVLSAQQNRIAAIERVVQSVVAVYDEDRQGGGSAVIIDPQGIAVTNHHVVAAAGVRGWAGLADGNLYPWELIGTDPGGDLAVIQLSGRDSFPASPLANSDLVEVGQWAMAQGNPFVLTEDQYPTVTLGIVSGVQRYQAGSGNNMLVYGNCIQIDSSINPGNSGGPLFNLQGEVIGINGRGSFLDRGRVNVGLGYAISANQVKNFLPDLLATKIAEHGSLDANFGDYGGLVRCTMLNETSPIAQAGLKLGDELLEFENTKIQSANQFTNLICTLPVGWPARLVVRTEQQPPRTLIVRLLGLPYEQPGAAPVEPPAPPDPQPAPPPGDSPQPEIPPPPPVPANEIRQREWQKFLSTPANSIRDVAINDRYTQWLLKSWHQSRPKNPEVARSESLRWTDKVYVEDKLIGDVIFEIQRDGNWHVDANYDGEKYQLSGEDGQVFREHDSVREPLTATETKLNLLAVQALSILAANSDHRFTEFGKPHIDGSDKCQQRTAWRLKWTDADQDWFYAWFSLADSSNAGWHVELLQAGPDLNSEAADSIVAFGQWQSRDGWWVPARRWTVEGIGAVPRQRWEMQPVEGDASGETKTETTPAIQPPASVSSALRPLINQSQAKLVKVFGAGVGRVEAYATGLVVSADGLIVTTQGVFLDGQQVRVVLADGATHPAVVLKRDRTLQLAVLKIDVDTPQYFDLSATASGQNGDWVVALSNAFKVADKDEPLSATLGIVSLRSSIDARLNERDVAYRGDLILIDAITSNPGAAGGAVVNLEGNLLGVIGRIINSSETNTRLNYAVPTAAVAQFVAGGQTTVSEPAKPAVAGKAELGLRLFEVGGLRSPAYIDRVTADGPAALAGLKTDDLIVTLAGEKIATIRDYNEVLKKLTPGQEVLVVVKRGVEVLRIPITPAEGRQ